MNEDENASPLPPGTQVHELVIKELLGRGGAGIVYAARHAILDQILAVKEFLPGALARRVRGFEVEPLPGQEKVFEGLRQKFLQEGRTLVELARPSPHPNIVQATDAFRANETVYLCMRFERGEPLDVIVKTQGPLSEAELRALLVPLLDGLAHAHRHLVLHRDIKPSNILIRDDGSPVLIDFGAAHQERPGGPVSVVAQYTPDFAAPEQMLDGDQGPWTDIYCLAAACVYALTGESPKGMHFKLEPEGRLAGVDPRLLAALNAALHFDWSKRPQNVGEWCEQLGHAGLDLRAIRSEPASQIGQAKIESMAQTRTQASDRLQVAASDATEALPLNRIPAPPPGAADATAVEEPGSGVAVGLGKQAKGPGRNVSQKSSRPARAFVLASVGLTTCLVAAAALWWWFAKGPEPSSTEAGLPPQVLPKVPAERANYGDAGEAAQQQHPSNVQPAVDDVPELRPETQSLPDMVDPVALVREFVSASSCAALTDARLSKLDGEPQLALQGFVRDERELDRLEGMLRSARPDLHLDVRDLAIAAPFCDIIGSLNRALETVPTHPGIPRLVLNHADRLYHQDEFLALTATQPGGAAGFLYLDFVDRHGESSPLLPNAAVESNFLAPGARISVGAPTKAACNSAPEACFMASKPHGNNLILAIWSARPLEPGWHLTAGDRDAMSALADLLAEEGRYEGAGVTLGFQFVTTAP